MTAPDEPRPPDPAGENTTPPAWITAPGGPDAVGCTCPTVANIGYRMGIDPWPLLDPQCTLHRPEHAPDVAAPVSDDPIDDGPT